MKIHFLIALALLLAGCISSQDSGVTVIVGAKLDGTSIDHSVVVIADGKFQAVGPQSSTPVPKGADIIGGLGMTIKPLDGAAIEAGRPANLVLAGTDTRTMRDGKWIP